MKDLEEMTARELADEYDRINTLPLEKRAEGFANLADELLHRLGED